MKLSKRQNLYTLLSLTLAIITLVGALAACTQAPNANGTVPPTVVTATSALTATVEATTEVAPTTTIASPTMTSTEVATSTTAVTASQTTTASEVATGTSSSPLVTTEKYKDIPVGFT